MFFLQLRQLCWKNYVVRTRSKFRVITELVWPLILFIILAWVRTRGLKEYKNECFLQEKALPSAGSINFLQNLLCTYSNNCNDEPLPTQSLLGDLQYEQAGGFISDVERILLNRVSDDVAASGSKASLDIAAGLAYAFKNFKSGFIAPAVSVPLNAIINQSALNQLADKQNITQLLLQDFSLNKLPTVDEIRILQQNPKEIFCNSSVLQSWLTPNASSTSLEDLSYLLCKSSTAEILSILNGPGILNQTRTIVEHNLGQSLHLDDWSTLVQTLGTVFVDVRDLDSLYDLAQRIKKTTVGQIAENLWSSRADSTSNNTSLASTFNLLCGRDVAADGNDTSLIKKRQESNPFRRRSLFKTILINSTRTALTPACNRLFNTLYSNPATRFLFEAFYPFIRGKIVYAPNNTASFNRIVQEVNATFQDLRRLQNAARIWLFQISPILKNITDRIDLENLSNLTQTINSTFPPVISRILISFLENATIRIETLKSTIVQIDYVANLLFTYIDCYEFDKFEGFATEEEAVVRGMKLMESTLLWAAIVFKDDPANSSGTDLPPHITYKIRMDSGKIDSTKRLKDFFETPIPRNSPSDMKYFTSGFIFLQDKIEQAIIRLQTNRTSLPGMVMQQFPSPCYVYDTFFYAIAQLFPLFMILSFVYPCAMIVKSIVHEKERRLKETMRTMGLGNAVHWVAWFIDSMSFLLIACVLLALILVFGQVLEKSNFLIILIFLLSFTVSTISLSFLISTFFSRANLAAACGGFIFFICFLPYNFLNLDGQDYSQPILISASLLSDVAFGIGCWYFATFEQGGTGAQWNNIATSPKDGDTYSLLGCILMMLLDAVIYLILTWYIEAVFPGEYGIPRRWYFMFQPSYWFESNDTRRDFSGENHEGNSRNSDLLEEEARDLRVGVSLRNLGKTYSNGKVAVKNLNLDFYEDQITSFLGHNGAGKTTTISILTGLYPPTTGTAFVNGLDIRTQIGKIRQELGLCPQHNVLFDKLTVEEHLRFYASLKTGEEVGTRKEIDKMIEDLGLSHKKYELSLHLSGGMKRKLSIGAAFIGNSKTVILDEPTAGVDPYSRRSIWDILLKLKAGRTIILTTHFMDEADLLGDRIAIISQGQLKCCGSSLFLKKKLGSGYYLTLVRKDGSSRTSPIIPTGSPLVRENGSILNVSPVNQDSELRLPPPALVASSDSTFVPICEPQKSDLLEAVPAVGIEDIGALVSRYIPNCSVVQDVGSDLVICLPEFDSAGQQQRDKFPQLFTELESNMINLGLDSYGVSDTTLEEIFLKVADDPSDPNNPNPVQESDGQDEEAPQREENGSDTFTLVSSDKLTGISLIANQFGALYLKRFWNSKRNLKGLFCEVILPAIFIIINQLSTMAFNLTNPEPALTLSPWLYGTSATAFFTHNSDPAGLWQHYYADSLLNQTGMGVRCLRGDPLGLKCSNTDLGLINPEANPAYYKDLRCPCDQGIPYCPANMSEADNDLWRFRAVTTDQFYDVSEKNISLWIVRTYKQLKKFRIGGFEFGVKNPLNQFNLSILSQDLQNLISAARLDQIFQQVINQDVPLDNATRILGTMDNIKVWFDNKAWASSVSYLNAINNVILRSSLANSSKDPSEFGITAINHPMNYSSSELQDKLTRQVGISVLHAISVIFSMSFVPASFVIFLVEERASKAKHLQFISGVKPVTFWTASYTWDLVNYFIPSFMVVFIFLAFDQQAYIGPDNIYGLILLLFFYGLASIPLMYPSSLIFSIPSSAFVGLACANLFLGVVTTIASFVLQLFDDQELKDIGDILNNVFLIFPHYCLGRGMIDMATVYFTSQRLELFGIKYERNIFEWDYLGRYFLAMTIQAIIFFTFTVLLHYQILPKCVTRYFQRVEVVPLDDEDEDVARERVRVETDEASTDELRLLQLTKVYGRRKVPATDRLSFGLKRGECFGLLGVNGAGKSTTFKMLTGDESVTSGDAFIGKYSILSHLSDAQQNLGYCPQEDALLSLLTGAEHLKLFASLRGVPKRYLKKVVNDSLAKLSLVPYKNRCAGTYSGGNKRKLATAIALIGNPAVVFLDEPSSGMDPRARRSLWQAIIDAVKDDRSVLLTSHSMEECQVLCTRLAIMVNGTLRCLGSAQHLKNRFGDGYMINVRCEIETRAQVMQSVQAAIPGARLREQRPRQLIWHVKPNTLPISVLFNKMEEARTTSNMVDYSITQTTLDDVFVRFARLQREVYEEDSPDPSNIIVEEVNDSPLHVNVDPYSPSAPL